MKIVVIGGSGLIGSNVVAQLRQGGHDVISASPRSGVNAVTGEGLAGALVGAEVVVDVANSPSFEDEPVMRFFDQSSRNLLAAGKSAGVKHHVALSVVGTDRLPSSGYFRAKLAQEKLIESGGVPYTILRATQFFEFISSIAYSSTDQKVIRLPSARMQPVAAIDVSKAVAELAVAKPANQIVELAGPESFPMTDIVRKAIAIQADPREVVVDETGTYFGALVDDQSLVPTTQGARIGETRFDDWKKRAAAK